MESKKALLRLAYLDSVLFIDGRYISSDNDEIRQDLGLGGVHQVLTTKFGFDNILNSLVAADWIKKKRLK